MPEEASIQNSDISEIEHCLIGMPFDLKVENFENEADKTTAYQNWLSRITKASRYLFETDSGDVLTIKASFNTYARVYFTVATLECNVKNNWVVSLNQYEDYIDQTDLFKSENTVAVYTNENQPEFYIGSIEASEPKIKAEDFYTQNVHKLPNVKAITYEKINESQELTTILNERNVETRDQIYEIEMQIFDYYPRDNFQFSVRCMPDEIAFNLFIKNKKLLYYKDI